MYKRSLSEINKQAILARQENKCANNINAPAYNLSSYKCLLWKYNDGYFDEAGYEFDHIDELSLTGNNKITNIQALCPNCHSVKTKKFMRNKRKFTSKELERGCAAMDIDVMPRKKIKFTRKN
jgi:5-methylcytosine-specific restriction endonuclease McrA